MIWQKNMVSNWYGLKGGIVTKIYSINVCIANDLRNIPRSLPDREYVSGRYKDPRFLKILREKR